MMTKAEFTVEVARRLDATKKEAGCICWQVFDALIEAVACNGGMNWPGLGKFERVERAARKGRNPQTGETIDIAAKNAVKFTPAIDFKDRIQ